MGVLVVLLLLGGGFVGAWLQDVGRRADADRDARAVRAATEEAERLAALAEPYRDTIRARGLTRVTGDGLVCMSEYVRVNGGLDARCDDGVGACYLLRMMPVVDCWRLDYVVPHRRPFGAIDTDKQGSEPFVEAGQVVDIYLRLIDGDGDAAVGCEPME